MFFITRQISHDVSELTVGDWLFVLATFLLLTHWPCCHSRRETRVVCQCGIGGGARPATTKDWEGERDKDRRAERDEKIIIIPSTFVLRERCITKTLSTRVSLREWQSNDHVLQHMYLFLIIITYYLSRHNYFSNT